MSDDYKPNDPLVQLQAEIDQMVAAAPEMARAVMGQYIAYKAEGFTDAQALYITVAMIHSNPGKAP